MKDKPSPDTTSLKNLRLARSLSQSEVAETIGTNANTVSRWERGVATPSPFYRRKLAGLFGIDPQVLFPGLNDEADKTTKELPPGPETGGDSTNETEETSQEASKIPPTRLEGPSRPPFIHTMPRPHWVYVLVGGITIFMLIFGGVFVFPSLLPKPPTLLFPPLCNGNFQSPNTSIVNTPAAITLPDGVSIGLSEGANIFDLNRPNEQEVQYKLQAAQATTKDPQNVVSSLNNALNIDPADAEAQIYLENWRVLGSNHPRLTFVVGVSFASDASRNVLQGAFVAQKECNEQNRQDSSKAQIVLMIANVDGDGNGNINNDSAKFVADQIVDQAHKDPTIVGILGWPLSAATINVNHQLKIRGSNLTMLAACSSSDELGEMYHFFRVCPADAQQAQIAVTFVLKTKQKKKAAILYISNSAWGSSLQHAFAREISKNKGKVVSQESYAAGDQDDMQRAVNKVLSQKPDAIFFVGYAGDLSKLLNIPQSHDLLIMGANALAITSVYPSPLPPNVYFTAFASPNQWDGIDPQPPFFQNYKDHFGTLPSSNGLPRINNSVMLGYDGMLTLLHASQQVLSKQNTINASDLEKELKNITDSNAIQGVTGRIAFNKENGDQDEHKPIFVEHIEGTNLVIDETHGCLLKDKCSP